MKSAMMRTMIAMVSTMRRAPLVSWFVINSDADGFGQVGNKLLLVMNRLAMSITMMTVMMQIHKYLQMLSYVTASIIILMV